MKNIIIMGSGRSGTSLTAGILRNSNYYMGHNLMPATHANPKGFFESFDIEKINEDLIRKIYNNKPKYIDLFIKKNLSKGQLWLARIKLSEKLISDKVIDRRIAKETATQPFCFKDPRFCYTLPCWRPFLPENTGFICVFRHPAITASSIIRQIKGSRLLKHLRFDKKDAFRLLELMYKHILEIHMKEGNWIFLHYDQLLQETGLEKIKKFTGTNIDDTFPEKSLKRSLPIGDIPDSLKSTYKILCDLAEYKYN